MPDNQPNFYNFNLTDLIGIILASINLILIIVVFVCEGKRTKKIEKHHDTTSWYQTFKFHSRIQDLLVDIDSFKETVLEIIDNGKTLDNMVECYTNFHKKAVSFKSDFLDVIEIVEPKKVDTLTNELDGLKDRAADVINLLFNTNDKHSAIDAIMSDLRRSVIKVGVKISLYK